MQQSVMVVCLSAILASPQADHEAEELKQLQGVWIIKSVTANGVSLSDLFHNKECRIDNLSLQLPGEDRPSRFRINTKAMPAEIDLINPDGGVFPGIYRLKDDKLVICYVLDRKMPRPKFFRSEKEEGLVLVELQRKKS